MGMKTFCERNIETVERVYFQFYPVKEVWLKLESLWRIETWIFFVFNNLIVFCKHFTHRCKY